MSGFCHVSMLIELDFESWEPAPEAYTRTAEYFPKRSRRLVHESIHYWQQFSHGYLLRLAQEDWIQMLEWEQKGNCAADGPCRAYYKKSEGQHGFSAEELCESLARFWEVVFSGPAGIVKEMQEATRKTARASTQVRVEWNDLVRHGPSDAAFDMAMRVSGRYGLPYAVARKVLDRVAGIVIFPFLAHFALKTSRPAHFFERFVEEVGPAAAIEAKNLGLFESPPRGGAEILYPLVERRCADVLKRNGEPGLLHASDLFASSPLRNNYVYWWSFRRLRRLRGGDSFDLTLCLAALKGHLLASQFAPPCLRFRDQKTIGLAHHYLKRSGRSSCLALRAADRANRACLELQRRWEDFQKARRQQLGIPASN
jgi:hypothetical protein